MATTRCSSSVQWTTRLRLRWLSRRRVRPICGRLRTVQHGCSSRPRKRIWWIGSASWIERSLSTIQRKPCKWSSSAAASHRRCSSPSGKSCPYQFCRNQLTNTYTASKRPATSTSTILDEKGGKRQRTTSFVIECLGKRHCVGGLIRGVSCKVHWPPAFQHGWF